MAFENQIMFLDYVSNLFAWSEVAGRDPGSSSVQIRCLLKKYITMAN